jgi:amino acid transporter
MADPRATPPTEPVGSVLARKASFAQTMGAVFWSFFGVRKSADYEQDVSKLNPLHLAVAGLLGAALFVGALLLLVRWVLSSGVAA